ncbi:MAG: macro domain-containing protein, partial [Candidatus Acidiferrales bacterium]
TGGKLKARFVIHAASMQLGGRTTAESLRASTRNSLARAAEKGLKTIAFPAVGTGIAGFPMRECAEIMLEEVVRHLKGQTGLGKVHFVLFDASALHVFHDTYNRLKNKA